MHVRVVLVSLALLGCVHDPPPGQEITCEYMGKVYQDGEVFPAGDGCNSCKCNPDGQSPGEWGCSLIGCEEGCPNELVGHYECPAQCAQEPTDAEGWFWCATICDDASVCNGMECHPDGYCVPTCTTDSDCQGTSGGFDRCDSTLGVCTFGQAATAPSPPRSCDFRGTCSRPGWVRPLPRQPAHGG